MRQKRRRSGAAFFRGQDNVKWSGSFRIHIPTRGRATAAKAVRPVRFIGTAGSRALPRSCSLMGYDPASVEAQEYTATTRQFVPGRASSRSVNSFAEAQRVWQRLGWSRGSARLSAVRQSVPKNAASAAVDNLRGEHMPVTSAKHLSDPPTADHDVCIVEDSRLSRSNGALRLIKGDQYFVLARRFELGRGRFVTVPDLHLNSHRLA